MPDRMHKFNNFVVFCDFFSFISDTNSFERLHQNGSNAYLIDRSRPTTVFVHGYSDSFQPKGNGANSFFYFKINKFNMIFVLFSVEQ